VAFLYLKQCHLRGKNIIPAPALTVNRSELGRKEMKVWKSILERKEGQAG